MKKVNVEINNNMSCGRLCVCVTKLIIKLMMSYEKRM